MRPGNHTGHQENSAPHTGSSVCSQHVFQQEGKHADHTRPTGDAVETAPTTAPRRVPRSALRRRCQGEASLGVRRGVRRTPPWRRTVGGGWCWQGALLGQRGWEGSRAWGHDQSAGRYSKLWYRPGRRCVLEKVSQARGAEAIGRGIWSPNGKDPCVRGRASWTPRKGWVVPIAGAGSHEATCVSGSPML